MRKQKMLFSTILVLFAFTIAFNSCKDDDNGPSSLSLASLNAGTIDLNGASAPTNVPANSPITATFNTDIDQATATNANITLVQDYDQANIPLTITTAGKTLTITPTNALGSGTLYKLSIGAGVKSTGGLPLTALNRTFTTEGTFVPAGQFAYWNFEDNANDVLGAFDPPATGIVNVTYVASRKTAAGKAASFDGSTSIIEIPNGEQLMNTHDFALAFWVKAVSTAHTQGHFVMGLGAFKGFQFEIAGDYSNCKLAASYEVPGADPSGTDLWFPGDGKTKDNGGNESWIFCKDLTGSGGVAALLKDKWAHVVCVYNSATKVGTMYINGEKMKAQDFNLRPATDALKNAVGLKYGGVAPEVVNKLAFGFIQSRDGTLWDAEPWGGYDLPGANHFKGELDDVRIFHKAITEAEVMLIYNSEKP